MSNAVSSELKETIRQTFKKACLLRLEGKETEAVKILQEELPPYIKQWQDAGDVSAQEIEDFFAAELARTENANWIVSKMQQRLAPQIESLQTSAQAEAMQELLNAQMHLGFDALKERLQAIMGEVVTYQGAEALGSRVSQELSTRVKAAVEESLQQIRQSIAGFATNEAMADQVATLKAGLSSEIKKLVDVMATPDAIAQVVREQIAQHDANVGALASKIDDLRENTGEAISQRTQEGVASEINALEQRQAQQMAAMKETIAQVVREQIAQHDASVSGLFSKLDDLKESTGEAISQRTQQTVAGEITALEQRQSQHISATQQMLVAALEKVAQKKDLESFAKGEHLASAVGQIKDTIAEVVSQQIAAHDARVATLATKIDDLKENAGEAISQRTQEGVASEITALEQRQAQQMAAMKETIAQVVREQIAQHDANVSGLSSKIENLHESAGEAISQRTQETVAGEISALEKRQSQYIAQTQEAVISALASVVKKSDLESTIGKSQTLLIQNLESQKKALNEVVGARLSRMDGLFTDLKVALVKRLEGMVSAETFEGRLMSTANMMAEAQTKALAETTDALAGLIDKRLAESTGPIYQRLSSVLTVSDWERMTRELNEKFLGRIEGSLANKIEETFASQNQQSTELIETVATAAKSSLQSIKNLQGNLSTDMAGVKEAFEESSKTLAERLATLYIENAQSQTDRLDALQQNLVSQQTQSLGALNAQQQNFITGLREENKKVVETLESIAQRQETLEQTQAQIASTLKAFEATLTNIEKTVETRLSAQQTQTQTALADMVKRLEAGMGENMSKRLENIQLVVKSK